MKGELLTEEERAVLKSLDDALDEMEAESAPLPPEVLWALRYSEG